MTQPAQSVSPSPSGGGLSLVLSPSSLARYTECEMKYFLEREAREAHSEGTGVKISAGVGATLGTATHTLLRARWRGLDWRAAATEAAKEYNPRWSEKYKYPEHVQKAVRLVERHEAMYPDLPRLIAAEFQFKIRHPYVKGLEIQGYQDGIVLAEDGLWILENKTMSRWDRLDWLEYDPQPATYMWAAREQGYHDIQGVLFDAIYTREWVEERDPAESFRRLWLPYDQRKVDEVLAEYAKVAARINGLSDEIPPIRNSGRACIYCDHKPECHEYLES